jgi:hypothetical protein
MATVGFMGPFRRTDVLAPNQSIWVDLGESSGFENCALSVTATPLAPGGGGAGHTLVLKVDDVNVSAIPGGLGEGNRYHAGCNVTNTGDAPVREWSVLVGVIRP